MSHADLRRGVRAIMADDGAGLDDETRKELLEVLLRHAGRGEVATAFMVTLRERMERKFADRAPCYVDANATLELDEKGHARITDLSERERAGELTAYQHAMLRVTELAGEVTALTAERDALQAVVAARSHAPNTCAECGGLKFHSNACSYWVP